MIEVVLEGLAANLEEAVIQNWFFEEGDPVMEGDDLLEITTPEGPVVIRASASGLLAEVYYDEGETVAKGEVLCAIDDAEDDDEDEDEEDDEKKYDEE